MYPTHPMMKMKRSRPRPPPPHVSISLALQNLFDSCRQVFKGPGTGTVPSPQDVHQLCSILDAMKPEDVGLSSDLQFFKPKKIISRNHKEEERPRVTSATIYKCKFFELCIFFLPVNAVIPLHSHPGMTVFSKLLLGTMHIKSYDWVDPPHHHPATSTSSFSSSSRLRLAKMKANRTMGSPCTTSVLYPTSGGNLHEFTAVTPCAMLDVLGPPYSEDHGHDCSYYKDHPFIPLSETEQEQVLVRSGKEIGEEGRSCNDNGYGWLEEIQIPKELEMEAIAYMGPKFILR